MANAPAMKNMMIESVIVVTMNTMVIPIALIVNVSQPTQGTTLMFVLRKMDSVLVKKTMTKELAMNAQMGTLVILIANPVTVNLVTQLKLYVIKLMEHVGVWTNSMEADVMFVKVNLLDILIAMIVNAKKTALRITPTFVT